MKKRIITLAGLMALSCALAVGCGNSTSQTETQSAAQTEAASETQVQTEETQEAESAAETTADTEATEAAATLEDGTYTADFNTDSSMFQVNEMYDGKGTLTVKDGKMTIHITLRSTNIVNLYPGLAEDAQKDGAELLQPVVETVDYNDGEPAEEVNAFDVPVPAIDEEFDLALIGTKGKWYDHKVKVSDPVAEGAADTFDLSAVEDGSYTIELTMEGGSGRASIQSPAQLAIADGAATAILEWSSPNYDYMLVNGEKYLPVNTEGNSVFEVPVEALDAPLTMIGDTVAMSTPHEVEYTVTFHSETLESAESGK